MLKNKPNALNFFGIRKMEVPPPHFEYMVIPQKYNLERTLDKWIETHLKGRYYLGTTLAVGEVNGLDTRLKSN